MNQDQFSEIESCAEVRRVNLLLLSRVETRRGPLILLYRVAVRRSMKQDEWGWRRMEDEGG